MGNICVDTICVYSTYLELYACGIYVWICIDYMYVEDIYVCI